MAGKIDYKQKYEELKARFMSSVDSAWQDGYQHGMADSQTEQAQMESQQADAMAQQQAGAAQPGQPGQEPGQNAMNPETEATPPISQNPNGDELDQHINKLETMLGKSEISSMDLGDLKKTLSDIRSLQVQINLTKSLASIKTTKLAKSQAPLVLTPKLQANLPQAAQKALSLQEKIVGDIFTKWAKDENKASNDISSILGVEGILKKD